ncbi:CUB and sushi domain-containing protein 3-like isoform X1 [Centruroides sculpturatus]|uniref:CUB and sushi domain-containing protein 3-like isoform X1 n=2 Tax=Centruroides sculpturatus TaxID=218467 RepID=UPI000C6D275A|nr:CUB and sushi domain-containing protein 3-like isoform X1 [Centruroides sculpturatus]
MKMDTIAIFLNVLALCIGYIEGQGCGFPGVPANGGIQPPKELYHVGETVTYFCEDDSVIMGSSLRDCRIDGRWSDEIPVCTTPLHPLGSPLAAQYHLQHRPQLAIDGDKNTCTRIKPRMTRWWRVSLNDYHTVQAIAVTMPDTAVKHKFILYVIFKNSTSLVYLKCATFEGVFVSQTLLLSCAEELRGNIIHIEDTRRVRQEFELCEIEIYVKRDKYKCGEPDRHVGSHVAKISPGRAHYSCSSGFMLNGARERVCMPNGQWSESAPKCLETNCSIPPPILHGKVDIFAVQSGHPSSGNLVLYSCNVGYMLSGNSTRMCENDGTWSGKAPTCHPIYCGKPEIDDDDLDYTLVNGTTTYGSLAEVYCKNNDAIDYTISCQDDGKWSELVELNCTYGSAAVMQSFKPELQFTESILIALVFAGIAIAIVTVSLIVWQRKDPTTMTEIDPPGPKEVISSEPVSTDRQPVLEPPLITSTKDAEEACKSAEEVPKRLNDAWSAYDRPNMKVRSLPLPPSRKSSAAGSKENIYEEIALWARRAMSVGDTTEEDKSSGRNTSKSTNAELLALYAKVDFEKKRKSRQMKERSNDDKPEGGPAIINDSQPFLLRELPPIPTEESSSEELSETISIDINRTSHESKYNLTHDKHSEGTSSSE